MIYAINKYRFESGWKKPKIVMEHVGGCFYEKKEDAYQQCKFYNWNEHAWLGPEYYEVVGRVNGKEKELDQ